MKILKLCYEYPQIGGGGAKVAFSLTALTVPAEDPDAIQQALIKLISDESLRTQLGKEAHERVKHHFTEEHVASMHQDSYRSVST